MHWKGNSPVVAMQHYAPVTEADLRGAAELAVIEDGKKTVQNQVQTAAATGRKKSHEIKDRSNRKRGFCTEKPQKTKACDSMRDAGSIPILGRAGFEPAKAHANGFTAHPL